MPESSSVTADARAARRPARSRRWLLYAVALFLAYGNAVDVLQPPLLRRAGLALPAPLWLRDAFLMSGMFTSFSSLNSDLFIGGLRDQTGAASERGRWIKLHVREHFAGRHGVRFTELFATHDWDMHGRAAQRRAWAFLARRIRARHNRLHPDHAIVRVRFGSVDWPQSPQGYRARKRPGQARMHTWYEEPEPSPQ